jgi:aspartate beta-hydroxylase
VSNLIEKASAHIKRKLGWWVLQRRARAAGLNPDDFQRIEEYLHVSSGLQEPRYTSPFQRPRHYFFGLTAKPWYDPADFKWIATLEKAHETIRKELCHIYSLGCLQPQAQGLADGGQWNVYYLYYLGRKIEENCRRCPQTTQLIDSLPGVSSTGLVYFSVLTAGTHIMPHCGPTNTRLRVHLGLVVPGGGQIRVGSETRSWEEGRCLLFDDSFEHEVWNSPHGTRVVLVLDFWHPDLTTAETWAIGQIMKMSTKARKLTKLARKNRIGV